MAYKLFLFDFDGTIADYLEHIKPLYNILSKKYNLRPIEDIEELRSLPSAKMISYLKIPFYKVPRVLREAQKLQAQKAKDMKLKEGMKEALISLRKNHKIGILSSNSKKIIIPFLKKHELLPLFDFIETYPKLFAKFIPMGKILLKYNLRPSQAIYVGDEVRDILATRKVRMDIAAVTWGFNNEELLKKYRPKYLIKEPKELLDLCN